MIKNLEDKISRLEDKIEAAERDGRSEECILSLRSNFSDQTRLLIELRKNENILLEKINQIGAVGKLSDTFSYFN